MEIIAHHVEKEAVDIELFERGGYPQAVLTARQEIGEADAGDGAALVIVAGGAQGLGGFAWL